MKLNHTPLGTLVSKKKVIASVAALALVGGIAPALINNTHAEDIYPYYDPDETIFAPIGQYYARYNQMLYEYRDDGYSISVEDTSIATIGEVCDTCIQGKKLGSTEVIIEKSGEDTIRMPLVSVEMTLNSFNVVKAGSVIPVVASLKGADDSVLHLDNMGGEMIIDVQRTGDRSVSIYAVEVPRQITIWLSWQIGDQEIDGYTYYTIAPVEGVDNIYHLPENEAILENAALDVLTAIYNRSAPGRTFTTEDGSIFCIDLPDNMSTGPTYKTLGVLDFNDSNLTDTVKNKLKAEFPEDTKAIDYKDIKVSVSNYGRYDSGTPVAAAYFTPTPTAGTTTADASRGGVSINGGNDYSTKSIGYFKSLANPLTMVIDVSDVEEDVEEGATRKWYVTHENDGSVEKIDATYDEDTKTIRFKTTVFGPHAYGYVDELESEEEPEEEEEESTPAPLVPNTGSPIQKVAKTAAITFAPLAAIAFGAFMVRNRKKAANKLAKKHNHFE